MSALSVESRRWIARGLLLLIVGSLLAPTAASALTHERTDLRRGTIESPANGTTVISVQGFKVSGERSGKKPARLVGVGPRGDTRWVYNGSRHGIVWFYDVDPVGNGSVLITGTKPGKTVVAVWNPETGETAWSRTFDWEDTHDIDLIDGDRLLVANMRNYNETTERNDARLLLYDLSQDELVWEWKFREHGFDPDAGGEYSGDWTHVNDVDRISEGSYLASVRNFDQVIVVNRTTKNVTMRLGSDGNHSVLYEQHNPQFLRGQNGTPTMLVADSENDRIVEYARIDGDWQRTWTLGGKLQWPRDADRLPNGNTLVTDSLNHRVVEVTPDGEVVWEYYAPWGTYDAERIRHGDEAGGPTMRELDATGEVVLNGSAGLSPGTGERVSFAEWMTGVASGTPVESQVGWLAARWAHVVPWIRPVWMGPWDFVRTVAAAAVLLGWVGAETVSYGRVPRFGRNRE